MASNISSSISEITGENTHNMPPSFPTNSNMQLQSMPNLQNMPAVQNMNQFNVQSKQPPSNQPQADELNEIITSSSTYLQTHGGNLPSRDMVYLPEQHYMDPQARHDYMPDTELQQYLPEPYFEQPSYKKQTNLAEKLYEDLHIPILISVIYFIFQMPFIRNICFQNFSFLCDSDGFFNAKGLTFISIIFGGVIYFVCKSLNYLQ